MSAYAAELLATMLLILLGNGVVANVVLNRTKGAGSGWIVITFGWGMAVFVAVFSAAEASGAHINPAVTLAVAVAGDFPWSRVPGYLVMQLGGAFAGALLVFLFYRDHFRATDDPDRKLACFCTTPAVRRRASNVFSEIIGTLVLIIPIFLMRDPVFTVVDDGGAERLASVGLGTLGALPVGLLVLAIGLSLGGTTGYAINPARDLGPRLAHALLPVPGKRNSDWSYAVIPAVAPLIAGVLAGLVARVVRELPMGA